MENISVAVMVLKPLMILLSLLSLVSIAMTTPSLSLSGCPEKCGNLIIPYPFGIGEECYKDRGYDLTCKVGKDGNNVTYFRGKATRPVLNISLDEAEITIRDNYFAYECRDEAGTITSYRDYWLNATPFTYSIRRNKFIAIGCNTIGYVGGEEYTSGCVSRCGTLERVVDGSCSGSGCCQSIIPKDLKYFRVTLEGKPNYAILKFSPCSFAILANPDNFIFDSSYVTARDYRSFKRTTRRNLQIVLDWAMGDQPCEIAERDKKSYACGPNSDCLNSANGPGYRCRCKIGFEGNPYILEVGCQDVDECDEKRLGFKNPCSESAICINTNGSYSCQCRKGYRRDGDECKQTVWGRIAPGMASVLVTYYVVSQYNNTRGSFLVSSNGRGPIRGGVPNSNQLAHGHAPEHPLCDSLTGSQNVRR